MVKAKELLERVLDVSPWVERETTVDRIIDGDTNKILKKVLVVWRASLDILKLAVHEGYDGVIVHEPTYYFHEYETKMLAQMPISSPKRQVAELKQKIILDNDLVIIRIHDAWDSKDDIGIAASFAKSLGLTNRIYKQLPPKCECRYDIEPIKAGDFLETVKKATKGFMIPEPVLYGDSNLIISKIGIGAGCCTDIEDFINMGCDIGITCDDGPCYWADIAFAIDRGFPIIRVSHAASEEEGIKELAKWVKDEFNIEVEYVKESCCN